MLTVNVFYLTQAYPSLTSIYNFNLKSNNAKYVLNLECVIIYFH